MSETTTTAQPAAPATPVAPARPPIEERLWPSLVKEETAPADAVTDAPAADPEPAVPHGLHEIPEAIKEARQADRARRLFSAQAHYPMVTGEDFKRLGVDYAQRGAAAAEFREMLADIQLSGMEASQLMTWSRQVQARPPTPEQQAEMHEEAVEKLRAANGGSIDKARADLNLAQKLIAKDPRWGAYLNATGLGSHPDAVVMFARLARSAAMQGRL